MPARRAFFPALLPHLWAHDCFMPMTAYGTDARACGPKLASPPTLCDGRDARKARTGCETFDDRTKRGRTIVRPRLHEQRAMLCGGTHLSQGSCIPFGAVYANVCEPGVAFCVKEDPSIRRWTHNRGKQRRDVVPCLPIVAHASDQNTAGKAAASFEESDPRDSRRRA